MTWVVRFAVLYLVGALFFAWGVASVAFQVFPYAQMKSVADFVRGDQDENLTIAQKLQNDLGGTPTRMMRQYQPCLLYTSPSPRDS